MAVLPRRDDALAQIFRRDARRFRQPRHDDFDDRVDLGIRQPHHQCETAGADTERPPAADLQIIRLQRVAADGPREIQGLDAAAHRQQRGIGRSLGNAQQARLRQFGDVDGTARADRHHPRLLPEFIGLRAGHAADKAFLDQRAEDAQRRRLVQRSRIGNLGQPQRRTLRQHAQDRADFLNGVELVGLPDDRQRRLFPGRGRIHAAWPLGVSEPDVRHRRDPPFTSILEGADCPRQRTVSYSNTPWRYYSPKRRISDFMTTNIPSHEPPFPAIARAASRRGPRTGPP